METEPTGKTHKVEIEGETIFIKRSFLGSRIVYPIKINGKINWKNLLIGSWNNLITIIIYIIIAVFLYIGIKDVSSSCDYILANPQSYCSHWIGNFTTDFTKINIP